MSQTGTFQIYPKHISEALLHFDERLAFPKEQWGEKLGKGSFDHEALRSHGLLPLALHFELVCDSELSPALKLTLKKQTFRQLRAVAELQNIAQHLQKQNLPITPWKGPTLSQFLYQHPTLRHFNDLDFLVPRSHWSQAVDFFLERSYHVTAPHHRFPKPCCFDRRSGIGLQHLEHGTAIDLNFKLSPLSSYKQLEDETFFYRAKWKDSPQSPEATLLCLVVHGSKHAWERASWLLDIAQFLWRCPDLQPAKLLEMAQQHQQWHHLHWGLELLWQHFPRIKDIWQHRFQEAMAHSPNWRTPQKHHLNKEWLLEWHLKARPLLPLLKIIACPSIHDRNRWGQLAWLLQPFNMTKKASAFLFKNSALSHRDA